MLDDDGMYEVEDDDVGLDVEITPVIKRLVLSPSCVIPLPDDQEKSLPKGNFVNNKHKYNNRTDKHNNQANTNNKHKHNKK